MRLHLLLSAVAALFLAGCPLTQSGEQPKPSPKNETLKAQSPRSVLDAPSSSNGDRKPARSVSDTSPAGETKPARQPGEIRDGKKPPAADEPLFANWPKPKAVLVVSGMQQGFMEPCGCTGLTNQKGGLMRRHTLIKQIKEKWQCQVVGLDVGELVRRFGRQQEIKYQRIVDALKVMNYQAVSFGPSDLKLSTGELLSAVSGDGKAGPFVSANVGLFEFKDDVVAPWRVFEAGGVRIGVTSVLGDSHHAAIAQSGGEVKLKPAVENLKTAVAKLKDQKCNLLVLLAHASMDETHQYAKQFPEFDLVVTAGGTQEPPRQPEKLPNGRGLLVEVGQKGLYTGVIGIAGGEGAARLSYQLVPLDARFKDSPEMVQIMKQYQEQLKDAWEGGLAAYGLTAEAEPGGRKFVGSKACADCHTTAYEIWEKTPHAHATESLVHPPERKEIARHFDAECVSCHATGWQPQEFLPFKSGYWDLKKTPHLTGSGCENCHGPGSKHVAAENDENAADTLKKILRDEMKLPLAKAEHHCATCHDADNSPDFHKKGAFEKYWKKVEHKGKN
jgi:hypothetical protein